jgi:PAT family beta-lactamase induction signal transducer AmpG
VTLSTNKLLRLFTLCMLYLAQGVPYGFVAYTLVAYLAEHGLDEATIGGVLFMATLPWTLKWVWGPVIDSWTYAPMGRRRPWILLAQSMMIITIAFLSTIPDPANSLMTIGWIILAHNVFNALQDVSVDALAVDLLPESERGKANGLMYGSKSLGTSVGAAGLGWVTTSYDIQVAMVVLAILLLAIMVVPLIIRERPGEKFMPWSKASSEEDSSVASEQSHPAVPKSSPMMVFKALGRAFSLKSAWLGGLLAILAMFPSGLLSPISNVLFLQDLEWTRDEYVTITGAYGVWLGLVGAVAGGFLADLVGARRLACIATTLLGCLYLTVSLATDLWQHDAFMVPYLMVDSFLGNLLAVSLFSLYMTISWPKVAATQFTAYMALLNLGTTLGYRFSGSIADVLETSEAFMLAGVLQIAVIAVLAMIDPRQTRRVLGDASVS